MTTPFKKIYHDQMGREVTIPLNPQRIISIVPSQTELLFDLGLKERIAGITRYCTHPASEVSHITKTGGTKQLDIELIKSLKPDLIIANKEENERSQVEELAGHFPVWVSNISNLEDALEMISSIGEITGKAAEAVTIINEIRSSFQQMKPLQTKLTVAYMIWRKPYMLAGNDTFINDMLTRCGLQNAVADIRYPELNLSQIKAAKPDVVLLSSEPYPFKQKHIDELRLTLPDTKMYLVDGELFSWYGSRLQYSATYFNQLINRIEKRIA